MIYGTLSKWHEEKNYFPPTFSAALSFLEGKELSEFAPGRYSIDGDKIFALVQDVITEPEHLRRFELHRNYIDIQLVLSGTEKHSYAKAPEDAKGLLEDSLAKADVAFYSPPSEYNSLLLKSGDYAIYLPEELHCPCCAVGDPSPVRKIVFKIRKAR